MLGQKLQFLYKTKATFSVAFVLPRYLLASKIPKAKKFSGGSTARKSPIGSTNNQRGASPPR